MNWVDVVISVKNMYKTFCIRLRHTPSHGCFFEKPVEHY